MSMETVEQLARALLYEGYLLYPYRQSAAKNHHRQTIGTLFPEEASCVLDGFEPGNFRAECILEGGLLTLVECRVRFLQCTRIAQPAPGPQELAHERESIVRESLETLSLGGRSQSSVFPPDGGPGAVRVQTSLKAERLNDGLYRVTIECANRSDGTGLATDSKTLISAHAILSAEGGRFVSLLDPPEALRSHAAACRNRGVWPVLVGEPGMAEAVLCSPIILYDYPRVAPESRGDLFDSTEIDEILTLRIRTLTDSEKLEMAATDERAAGILERSENLSCEELLRLHGAFREVQRLSGGRRYRPGDRVRLRPRGPADAFDLLLAGRTATVAAVEHDYEGRVHLAVTVDDDPGRDLGAAGRPGHRFFYGPDEVEPVEAIRGGL